ncbi:MAG: PQQ-binding-like beta-propeller repeat protein, partial [Pirellulales bacterium]
MVAVDRHTHRIEWAHRFSEKPASSGPAGGGTMYSQRLLNERWCAAAPIVSNGSVFFAPPEQPDASGQDQPQLVCLEARTGSPRWARAKGNALYLAGVFNGRPLVVGRDDITLLNPADGTPAWTTLIPDAAGPPSGRGIAVGDRFLLPLHSGQLWAVDLSDGQVAEKSNLSDEQQGTPLGNLAVCRGMLLSLGPFGIVGFEQRAALQQEINARLAGDPSDVWAAVKQAEMFIVSGEHADALRVLRLAEAAATDDQQLQERRRELTFDSLIAVLTASPEANAADFADAARLAAGDEETLDLERLSVDREIAAGRWTAAFDRCQQIAEQFGLDRIIEDGPTSLRLDVWLGGRLADVAAQAPPEIAEILGEQIADRLESSSLDAPAAASLERMYGFHPAAQTFLWRLIEDAAFRKDFAGAEIRLRRFIEQAERTTAAAALARLGDLLLEFGQPVDSAVVFARLAAEYGDVLLPSLKTGAETARERFSTGTVDRADLQPPPLPDWSRGEYRISHDRVVNSDDMTPQSPLTRQLR